MNTNQQKASEFALLKSPSALLLTCLSPPYGSSFVEVVELLMCQVWPGFPAPAAMTHQPDDPFFPKYLPYLSSPHALAPGPSGDSVTQSGFCP